VRVRQERSNHHRSRAIQFVGIAQVQNDEILNYQERKRLELKNRMSEAPKKFISNGDLTTVVDSAGRLRCVIYVILDDVLTGVLTIPIRHFGFLIIYQ
jgi:hypothetical protein